MGYEFVQEKVLTKEEVEKICIAAELSLSQTSEETYVNKILNLTITGFSLWVSAPITVAVATLAASLVFETVTGIPSARELMEKGMNEMMRIEAAMNRNHFEKVRLELGKITYFGNNTSLDIIQAATAFSYYRDGDWYDYS